MTQVQMFSEVQAHRVFQFLRTGERHSHDCAPDFYGEDFQQLDAPSSFPAGAHQAYESEGVSFVFACVAGSSR